MNYITSFLALFLLVSCSTLKNIDVPFIGEDTDDKIEEIVAEPDAQTLYDDAMGKLDRSAYRSAIIDFEEVERLYPFSPLATHAQIMIAYAHYSDGEYNETIDIVGKFVRLHPAHRDVGYMYYLKAMSYYERIADVKRDQDITLKSLDTLEEIIRRFPDSSYGRDAKLKRDLVRDHLAGKEMEIGRFYLNRKQYIGAINRFKRVVEKHQTTNHIEEALYRLVESYLSIGVVAEAQKYAAVLGSNYPASKWYQYAYRILAEKQDNPEPNSTPKWYSKLPIIGNDESYKPAPIGKDGKAGSFLDKIKRLF